MLLRRVSLLLAAGLSACGGASSDQEAAASCTAQPASCCATGEPLAAGTAAELHQLLSGRWQLCGGDTLPAGAAGVEFRGGTYWQFLRHAEIGDALVADPANMGWQIDVGEGTCGAELSLSRATGGYVTADARVYDGSPRTLRLDFRDDDGAHSSACFVSVR